MQLAFIWDMDGTLVDSYPAIVPAALESLSAQGVSYDREKLYQEVIRTSVGDVLEKLASQPAPVNPGLFSDEEIIISEILSTDTDNLTPMNALQAIARWKKALSGQ